ncbi:Hypp3001 [Branchiostoma lanceolatum]|uniref:Hypp3001 protein n=1 Tax=Branchiostoma lanceolatum TaxID=7740 RepID=A0A8K0EQ53_BRALA|nr:Hypp3001 [Branchiostoma lanceolatum]
MRPGAIANTLAKEGLPGHRTTVGKHVRALDQGKPIIYRPPRFGGQVKMTPEHDKFIDAQLRENDELTSVDLQKLLRDTFGLDFSKSVIKRHRYNMGWVRSGPRYCQVIREPNRVYRLAQCKEWSESGETFDDVIFTDESLIMLDNHAKLCFRNKWDKVVQAKLKPRFKHPVKVYIWAGISKRGATRVLIFTGIMDSVSYVNEILHRTLRPWIQKVFPNGHRFQQDNDPKHCSKFTRSYLQNHGVNWYRTSAESPDLNPIENLWAELKHHLRKTVKPRNQAELVNGILQFWKGVDEEKCQRYIGHLHKVIPKVIEMNGGASGF